MTHYWPALAILSAIAIVLGVRRLLARMEEYRRELDGVETEGGWLFDVEEPE